MDRDDEAGDDGDGDEETQSPQYEIHFGIGVDEAEQEFTPILMLKAGSDDKSITLTADGSFPDEAACKDFFNLFVALIRNGHGTAISYKLDGETGELIERDGIPVV